MLAGTLAFATGIYCSLQLSFLPSFGPIICLPVLFILSRRIPVFRYLLLLLLGFYWSLLLISNTTNDHSHADIEGTVVELTGVVSSLTETYTGHVQFLFDVDTIVDSKQQHYKSPGTVRLNWYKTQVTPAPGETWQLKAKLKRPYSFMNPGGFDYETWMLRQAIKATGYVKNSRFNQRLDETKTHYILRLRYALAQKFKAVLDKPLLGLVMALSLGDRSQLEINQWQVLTRTGTNHLIAISGLHLGLIAGFIYLLTHLCWRRFYFATQLIPAPTIAAIMSFVGAFFYAALAGFSLPTQRALIMIGVFLFSLLTAKRMLTSNVVCIAIILILIMDPLAIIAADFWLSFTAVILILYITRYRTNKRNLMQRWLYLQCLLSLALFPLLIFWFKQIPFYSVLANIIAIPMIGFIIVPLILLAMIFIYPIPALSAFLYFLTDKLNDVLWSYLSFLSKLDYAVVPVIASNPGILLLAMAGVFIVTMPAGLPGRWLGLFCFLPLIFPLLSDLKSGEFKLSLLDVGQGLSAVVKTKEHVLVYDTGARFSERFNIGDAVLSPFLRAEGIQRLSMLMVSHGDNDHIGGSDALLKNFKIDHVLSSVPEKFPFISTSICYAGQTWTWDSVKFEVLHPLSGSSFTGNNASCVLKVSSQYGSVLLTGDIEKQAENSLVQNIPDLIKADIMLVPHHGSKTSSTDNFIGSVAPKYGFISAGYRNRFGFPKQDIMSRYESHGVKTFVSYKTGELSAKFAKTGLIIEQFRSKIRRFWHH